MSVVHQLNLVGWWKRFEYILLVSLTLMGSRFNWALWAHTLADLRRGTVTSTGRAGPVVRGLAVVVRTLLYCLLTGLFDEL